MYLKVGAIFWLAFVLSGFAGLTYYSTAASKGGRSVDRLPSGILNGASDERLQLVVFLHPKCPCSRATVRELQRILARNHAALVHGIVFVPAEADSSWFTSDLAAGIGRIARIQWDAGGSITRTFGVRASGHVLLYDQLGRRIFSGGITAGRGHEGDSPGKIALTKLLHESVDARVSSASSGTCVEFPVFGCPIVQAGGGA